MNSYLLLSTLNLALGGLVFLLGIVILRENPAHRVNRTVALMLFFGGLGAILAGAAFLAARGVKGSAAPEILNNVSYLWEFFFPTLFLFACLFPEERPFVRRVVLFPGRRWAPGFGTLVFAPHTFHFALTLLILAWKPTVAVPSEGLLRLAAPVLGVIGVVVNLFLLVHRALFSLVNLGFGAATMALLVNSTRRATVPRIRQQLRVITVGLGACLGFYSAATLIPTLLNLHLEESVRATLIIAALTTGPGSIAYSIVRYRFLDARLLARRGIVYALVSGALVGFYLLVVSRLGHFVARSGGFDERVFDPVLLILAVALFQPAVARLEELLDRLMLRDPNDYRNVLRQLGRDLQTTIDLDVLLSRTIHTLSAALLPRSAIIVALAKDRAIARTAEGETLPDETLSRLAEVLPRVPGGAASVQLSSRLDGISEEDVTFLRGPLATSLVVPMRWRSDLVGALLLGEKLTGTSYGAEDVTLLTTLAAQVSVSMQNALLLRERVEVARLEEEMSLARRIQRAQLISDFPLIPGCEVHALSIPSKQVGGDFYDVVPVGDGSYLLAIADVSGKGVPAALLSSMLQASLRTQAGSVHALPDVLRNINTLLYRSSESHQFATFFLARIECHPPRLTFSNAGHNWPVLVRGGVAPQFLDRGGPLLGVFDNAKFEQGMVALTAGDCVVLYTDGISEAANAADEQFGDERLVELVRALPRDLEAREVADRILEGLRGFLGPVEPQDDMTLLVLRTLGPIPAMTSGEPAREVAAAR
ncbi:MAG TPA: SpoIIE family protein phosphatase [Candidatus Udaeobacter sp.]|jgi:sigma-B regulation protein RsbU (phosphoserine phosphatase)|nr:SpoIIE family protein phosphatase [Candidatus Udaeobacter sp.]